MHQFKYASPATLEELLDTYAAHSANSKLLAGGTDLIVQMRAGSLTPGLVIDVKQVPELNQLVLSKRGLTIGAAVSCRTLYENASIASACPALDDAARLIGGIQIQGRASIGGNLCNASPSADAIPALIVSGALAVTRSIRGERRIAVEDFCTGPGTNILARDEILISLELPPGAERSGSFFLRFTPRNEMDIAVVNAASMVVLSVDGHYFETVRIAIGAVGPTPIMLGRAADALQGQPVNESSIEIAAEIARQAAIPISDMRGSTEQRKHLAGVLVTRSLNGAIERVRGAM